MVYLFIADSSDKELVDNYTCYNLSGIVTLINAQVLEQMLIESNYDKTKTNKLVQGFTNGFDLGYRGPLQRQDTSANLPFRVGTPVDMWNKIMKEVKLGRYAGPYEKVPYESYVQSPIGLVPKTGGKTRLIFHLSYDFKSHKSINYYTPDEICSVKYKEIDHAIATCLKMHTMAGQVFTEFKGVWFSKTDAVSAFRVVPSKPCQHFLFVIKVTNPENKKTYFFIDKCLPFGSSISCAIFQAFSDALAHIMEFKTGFVIIVTNSLDDFLLIAFTFKLCHEFMNQFLLICKQVGCPTSLEKTEGPSQLMNFLGMLLDGKNFMVAVPIEKRIKAMNLIDYVLDNKKVTIKFIQRLTGTLNFLNKAIVPGRTFTRAMYNGLKLKDSKGHILRQHHHVHVKQSFRQDAIMWKIFLQNADAYQLCHPFVDLDDQDSNIVLPFYSDVAKKVGLGLGAVYDNQWLFAKWNDDFIMNQDPSIEFLELLALTAAVLAWEEDIKHVRVVIFNNNQAVMGMVNKLTSPCLQCMKLIRILVLDGMLRNRKLKVKFIPTRQNILADALSRLDFRCFWNNAPRTMNSQPTKMPKLIWPVEKLWFN